MSNRQGFNFLLSYFEVYKLLPTDKDKSDFMECVFNKQFHGQDPEIDKLSPMCKMAYISQKHSLDKSVKGFEDKTGKKIQPLEGTFEANQKPLEHSFEQVQEEEEEEVQVEEKDVLSKKTKNKKFNKGDFKKNLLEAGAEINHINDWFAVRDKRKGVYTETALKAFLNECNKNNFPIHQAVKLCAENNWSGFKVQWVKNLQQNNGQQNSSTEPKINRQTADTIRQNLEGWGTQ